MYLVRFCLMRWTIFVNYYNERGAPASRLVIHRLAYIIRFLRFKDVDLGMNYASRRVM